MRKFIVVLVLQSSLMAVAEFEFMKELSSYFSETPIEQSIPENFFQASVFKICIISVA